MSLICFHILGNFCKFSSYIVFGNWHRRREAKNRSWYLVPADEQEGAFASTRVRMGSEIALLVILKRGDIDYERIFSPSPYSITPRG